MYGSRRGYVSRTLLRTPRWAEDLTLDFAPGVNLVVIRGHVLDWTLHVGTY